MSLVVTGSLAFDHIMTYPGTFDEALVRDPGGPLNASFVVHTLERRFGGSGGAIAYNLALLGERPLLVATAGDDFADYRQHLERHGVDTSGVLEISGVMTAACFITTDGRGNQITSFYGGAIAHAARLVLREAAPDARLVIISPNHAEAMVRYVHECMAYGIPFVYEPGQQVLALEAADLMEGLREALCVCLNDYELAVIADKTGVRADEITGIAERLFVTHGEIGSTAYYKGTTWTLPAIPPRQMRDPTGAGEAYLAGIVQGLMRDDPPERYTRAATLAGSYAVEEFGTQGHRFTPDEFAARYDRLYRELTS